MVKLLKYNTKKNASSKKKKSASKKKSVSHLSVAKNSLSHYNKIANSYKNQEFVLVPDGVGGLTVDLQPKGARKRDPNAMFGSLETDKLSEDDYVLASMSQYGGANAFLPDGRARCLDGDYRTLAGNCRPIPATGSSQYLPYTETNAFVPRRGLYGGSNRVIRVPDEHGRLRNRQVTSRGQGNALFEMLTNPGTEASGGYYTPEGDLRTFYPNHYTKEGVPSGYVVGPNNWGENGKTKTPGKLYNIYDTAGMDRDGLKLGRLTDGRYAATPKVYKDGNSMYGVSPPLNMNIPSGLNYMGLTPFPPRQNVQGPATILNIDGFRSLRRRA